MSGWFTTADGRRFSPEQRKASAKLTKAAIARGEFPPATSCNRCGQTEGYVGYHNHDYAHPTKFCESLCIRCHMVLHSEHFAPEQCAKYWAEIRAGKRYPGVSHSAVFAALGRDHDIVHPRNRKKAPPEPVPLPKILAEPSEPPCRKCGESQGLMRWDGLDDEEPELIRMCWRCFNVRHAQRLAPKQCAAYWRAIAAGKRWPAVTKSDPEIMARDHGIVYPMNGLRLAHDADEPERVHPSAVPQGQMTLWERLRT